jgi:hypothetical protein
MRLVIIESPFSGDIKHNVAYARLAIRDSLLRGESPFASHLLYTQPGVLDDSIATEREQGIRAGHAWYAKAELCAIYVDYGVSRGMTTGIEMALEYGVPLERRHLAVSLLKTMLEVFEAFP